MLTLLLSWSYYRFLKSGFLLDFFFKRLIYRSLQRIFIVFSIIFSEKFFIEEIFFKYNFIVRYVTLVSQQWANVSAITFFFLVNLYIIVYFV